MSASHEDRIREQFRLQAATFSDEGFAVRGLEWIVELLGPNPDEQVLDVAAGAAHLGRALAPHVAHVSAVDITPEMLEQGRSLAHGAGLGNVVFAIGDATALPWLDDQFDLVACRLTLHQVDDPERVLREMVRVTRPGGRVAVTDMIVDDDPAVAAEANRLERLRDPSHHRTLGHAETLAMVRDAGADVRATETRNNPVEIEDWMARTDTPSDVRDQIRERFRQELAGGAPTGLRPQEDGTFTHVWATTVATPR
ncbi:class I SAM-dependent methyltransferase [Allosaccharopolyspora coralli]|nr:methyltransferase domain-containing protein [Allosaccharopolyspora coralli]